MRFAFAATADVKIPQLSFYLICKRLVAYLFECNRDGYYNLAKTYSRINDSVPPLLISWERFKIRALNWAPSTFDWYEKFLSRYAYAPSPHTSWIYDRAVFLIIADTVFKLGFRLSPLSSKLIDGDRRRTCTREWNTIGFCFASPDAFDLVVCERKTQWNATFCSVSLQSCWSLSFCRLAATNLPNDGWFIWNIGTLKLQSCQRNVYWSIKQNITPTRYDI